jgi:hypothetical protein
MECLGCKTGHPMIVGLCPRCYDRKSLDLRLSGQRVTFRYALTDNLVWPAGCTTVRPSLDCETVLGMPTWTKGEKDGSGSLITFPPPQKLQYVNGFYLGPSDPVGLFGDIVLVVGMCDKPVEETLPTIGGGSPPKDAPMMNLDEIPTPPTPPPGATWDRNWA